MTTIYHSALELKELNDGMIFQHLRNLTDNNDGGVFFPLEEDKKWSFSERTAILMYIIYGYSINSPYVVFGADVTKSKKAIAQLADLPDYLYLPVLSLTSDVVRQTIARYLDYQSDRDFTHLAQKKDLYEKLQRASVNDVTGEDGKTNFKLLKELSELSDEVLLTIDSLEDKLRQRYDMVIANKETINKIDDKDRPLVNLNIENSPHILGKRQSG